MIELFTSTALPAPFAVMFAPAPLVTVMPDICNVPPPVASRRLLLVTPPEPFRVSVWPDVLALIVELLINVKPPFPMVPAPWIVLLVLVRVRLPVFCWINTPPLLVCVIVSVPPPDSVVSALRPSTELLTPVVIWMTPWLLIVPETLRLLLLPLV